MLSSGNKECCSTVAVQNIQTGLGKRWKTGVFVVVANVCDKSVSIRPCRSVQSMRSSRSLQTERVTVAPAEVVV